MQSIKVFTIVGLWLGYVAGAMAAPAPGAATSAVTNPQLGLYNSAHGFRISAGDTDWQVTPPPADTRYIVQLYQSPNKVKDSQASLSVRVDNLKKNMPLNDYVQQWIRDYPKFGFEVLGSKPFNLDGNLGYVIDLKTKATEKQLRQVVFVRDRKAVILTCRDAIENFETTLKSCNSIIKTFAWNSPDTSKDSTDGKSKDIKVESVKSKDVAPAGDTSIQ